MSEGEEKSCEEVFTYIYDHEMWGVNEDGTPSSGWGSWPEFALPYLQFLVDFMNTHQIRSVVDVGCGDWAFSRYVDWGPIVYTGIDVVKEVIEKNGRRFSSPNIRFVHGDILKMELPKGELLVCKDVLQHLTNADIALFLSKIKKFKHCLITNDCVVCNEPVGLENKDTTRGPNRPLDLTKPPFNIEGVKIFTYPLRDHVKQILYVAN